MEGTARRISDAVVRFRLYDNPFKMLTIDHPDQPLPQKITRHDLGLMCKAMLVSLPLVLLALDYWPLGRLARNEGDAEESNRERLGALLVEKVPLFVLVALSSAVTWLVQAKESATASAAAYPLGDRVANAAISYGRYLRDAAWPSALSCFYPHPRSVGEPVAWGAAAAWSVALAALTLLAWRSARRYPAFTAGWAWYLVALVPVIGLVQVGAQARADRYVYVPLIGIFIASVWGLAELGGKTKPRVPARAMTAAIVGVAIGALAMRARAEVGFWRDGATLYDRAIRLDARNWLAWNNLGTFQLDRNDFGAPPRSPGSKSRRLSFRRTSLTCRRLCFCCSA